jgi:hypothetical protein
MAKQIRYNKSKTYLLPLLSEFIPFDFKYFFLLENTFIFDNMNKYQNSIYLLHKIILQNKNFTNYENKLLNNDLFQDLIDIDAEYSLYVFKFPREYLFEYEKFKYIK